MLAIGSRHGSRGFVVTIEFLLVMAVFVLPLLIGIVFVSRKAYTLFMNEYDYQRSPYSEAVVVDSSSPVKVVGRVVGWDPYEAPIVIFREDKKKGGVALGVRPDRLTTYAEVFYSDAACTTDPRVRTATDPTSSTLSNDNIPTGFLYQDFGLAAAMGNENKLYVDSAAYAALAPSVYPDAVWADVGTALGLLHRRWLAARDVMARALTGAWVNVGDMADVVRDLLNPPAQAATGNFYLFTGQTGAQTQIDVAHTSNWYVKADSATNFVGGRFTIKRGPSTTAPITLTVRLNGPTGVILATKTLTAADVSTSYTLTEFGGGAWDGGAPAYPYSLVSGTTYYVSLTSSAVDTQSTAYFIKRDKTGTCLTKVNNCTSAMNQTGTVTSAADAGSFTIRKSSTTLAQDGSTYFYTISLGNDGGATTGTMATVSEDLPAGVTAVGASAGTNVSSVACKEGATTLFSPDSTPGAVVTCTVTLSSGIPPGVSDGARITLQVKAALSLSPGTSTDVTNYVSVDKTGGTSPPAPGASCVTPDCASVSTTIQEPATPASLVLRKDATASVAASASASITYTFTIGNDGGSTYTEGTATVTEQLPAGVVAVGATPGATVTSVDCGGWPSAPGALLTCTVSLSGTIAAGNQSGAMFTLTADAPTSAGYYVNYASVDPDGAFGMEPAPTPGDSCVTRACATAGTAVDVTFSATAVGYVWRSQSVSPPTAVDPVPPCYAVAALPDDLVSATEIIDFDNYYSGRFRVAFRDPVDAPVEPCPGGECN